MGIKAQQYQTFYRHIRDKEDGQTVTWQVEDWENETAIWNRALRKAGLFHRPDGSYIYQGKKIQLDSLLFPERLSVLASGDNRHSGSGEKRQFWSNENRHLQIE